MIILLKKVLIADKNSVFNNTVNDILIIDGIVTAIEENITSNADIIFNEKDTTISIGWVDIFSNFCEPGIEHKETLLTGAKTAIAGGFTNVFVLPNTNPTIDTQSQVNYIVEKSYHLPITIHPLGAISKKTEGNELAEMYDMKKNGAVGFTDGINPIQSTSLFLKALQYVKSFNGTLLQMPIDKNFSKLGLMNEGIVSTQLGLPGIPAFAEILMIKRDIELLKYTQSKLHITGISTAESVALINAAKQDGLQITCSVTPHHLLFCDEDLATYDANLKLNPSLRTKADMLALRQAVFDGDIDCIASHHTPQHVDNKMCEFEYASNGIISLQTAFAIINTVLPTISTEQLVNIFSQNARNIFNLTNTTITVGAVADFTLFTQKQTTTLTKENNKSKSSNSPLFNCLLKGKVVGIVHKGKLHLN